MTIIDTHDGHDVIGTKISMNVGSGLNPAMKVSPQKYRNGDRVLVIVEAEVVHTGYDPAVAGDYDGPELLTVKMKALAATPTNDLKVAKLIEAHKKAVNKASEIEGQRSIEDEMGGDDGGE